MLRVDESGAMHLRTAKHRNGAMVMRIEMQDDGSMVGGGKDSMLLNFTLIIIPVNDPQGF